MKSQSRLHNTLVDILSKNIFWKDFRHIKTVAWMIVGLINSGKISPSAWVSYVVGKAIYAQSTIRRFTRWLNNDAIEVHYLYGPMIQQAICEWGNNTLYLALDTSMLWNNFCIIRISIIYRGRAVPVVWKVIEHSSSAVKFDVYKDLLEKAARLLPFNCNVVFLADRGFADTKLMRYLTKLGWHWRIRIKSSFWIHHLGRSFKLSWVNLLAGQALFWHNISVTNQSYGPVNLAIGRSQNAKEYWIVLSDEATDFDVFDEYGLRFDIEENFLDDKSNGFQLESSQIRSAKALERLCLILAMATLYLVSQGTDVVQQGKRRWVDPHWFRGSSYLKIGWNWVKTALNRGYKLITKLHLSSETDPEPALASRKYERTKRDPGFNFFASQMN